MSKRMYENTNRKSRISEFPRRMNKFRLRVLPRPDFLMGRGMKNGLANVKF